eukprot:Gb_05586 [translate_table: standard]
MGCVSSVSFVVLINGVASSFFDPLWGLRQGCPLSPYLFLLIVEGLSHTILEARRTGRLRGIKVGQDLYLTHLLFMDNVLCFTNSSLSKGKVLKEVLSLFCNVTSMEINEGKLLLCFIEVVKRVVKETKGLFNFQATNFDECFKYLGYTLKPNSYGKGSRLTLVKSFLEAIPVYWQLSTLIPKGLHEDWASLWNNLILELEQAHIHLRENEDSLIWVGNLAGGTYEAKLGYKVLMSTVYGPLALGAQEALSSSLFGFMGSLVSQKWKDFLWNSDPLFLVIDKSLRWGFLDGACQAPDNLYGVGGILLFSDTHYLSFKGNLGRGTNNLAEFMALKILLKKAYDSRIREFQVFEDSSLVVNWMQELNVKVDDLSKEGLLLVPGKLLFLDTDGDTTQESRLLSLNGQSDGED